MFYNHKHSNSESNENLMFEKETDRPLVNREKQNSDDLHN